MACGCEREVIRVGWITDTKGKLIPPTHVRCKVPWCEELVLYKPRPDDGGFIRKNASNMLLGYCEQHSWLNDNFMEREALKRRIKEFRDIDREEELKLITEHTKLEEQSLIIRVLKALQDYSWEEKAKAQYIVKYCNIEDNYHDMYTLAVLLEPQSALELALNNGMH